MILNSAHWGAFRLASKNGRIERIVPFEADPAPSDLLEGIVEAFDHPTRIRRPAIRKGWLDHGVASDTTKRGAEPFVEVGWDEALDLAAKALHDVKSTAGNQAIFGGSYGWSSAGRFHHAKTQVKRFLNCFGGCVEQVNNYSFGAGMVLLPHIVGDNKFLYGPTTQWSEIAKHTEIMLAFGGLPNRNTQIESGGCGEHIQRRWVDVLSDAGRRIVNISPLRDDVSGKSEWMPIHPGSDTALILALCHTLLVEDICDRAFMASHCEGFPQFEAYLRSGRGGAAFDAHWAAGICGADADAVRRLARDLVRCRSFIALNWSMQRSDFGEQPFWAAIALACMTGQVGLPGGGVGFGYGSMNGTGNSVPRFKTPLLPAGKSAINLSIPVARISDLLLKPGEELDYNGEKILLPEIQLVYWAGGNPYHHHQDLNRLVHAWQKPRTVIVHETHWTATARRADIVFPATTTIERNDLGASSSDRFLIAMKKCIEPYAEARDDFRIFSDLASRLGFGQEYTEGRTEMEWLEYLYEDARVQSASRGIVVPDFSAFWQGEYLEFPPNEEPFNALAAYRADPAANKLGTPSGRIEIFSQRIADFGYNDCPGHPVWRPAREWRGAPLSDRYPLHLITNQPATRLHGQMDAVGISRKSKIRQREPIRINPAEAERRGMRDGDIVRVFNDRGACLAGLIVSDAVMDGVAQMATGAWFDPVHAGEIGSMDAHGNPNILTHDIGTSALSQGPSAQSCLVEIEPYNAPLPPITVHMPPPMVARNAE
ncbi:molybdopterin-dependent oxidoreductase [Neorhizobium sp. NCHU2750]|uniref:molybdopterin-dependent oxidoreductase n=1 Tax=Neorhizobium sp. NCHU2750 TaxID=1825976 RepID=UPI000E7594EB|nr:biotin/methionine sulfoxide reductase [Neorhizobium sp. NCHU2750]